MREVIRDILNEASLSRVYQHSKGHSIGIISAHRREKSSQENDINDSHLRDKIRKAGYGYVKIKGKYIENKGTKDEVPVTEKSVMIFGHTKEDSGHLLGHLKKWGREYNQDAILHKPHDSEEATVHGLKPDVETRTVGKFHPNRISDYSSHLKNGRSFVFESIKFLNEKSFFQRSDESEF